MFVFIYVYPYRDRSVKWLTSSCPLRLNGAYDLQQHCRFDATVSESALAPLEFVVAELFWPGFGSCGCFQQPSCQQGWHGGLAVIGGQLSLIALVVILISSTAGQNYDDRFVIITSCLVL